MTEERQRFESVWDALEDSPEQAAGMRRRSEIMLALRGHIETWDCTQAEAAKRLAVTQPRLNDLMRGRIHRFNLEALIALAERAGFAVRIDLVHGLATTPRAIERRKKGKRPGRLGKASFETALRASSG